MATLFLCEDGTIVNMDNITHITKYGEGFIVGSGDEDSYSGNKVYFSSKDLKRIKPLLVKISPASAAEDKK